MHPTPENTLLGVGGGYHRGACKNPAAGGFKIPPPSPWKCRMARHWGRGEREYTIAPRTEGRDYNFQARVNIFNLPCPSFPWLFCFTKENLPKLPRIFHPCRTHKSTGKTREKTPFKQGNYRQKKSNEEIQAIKEGRTGFGRLGQDFPEELQSLPSETKRTNLWTRPLWTTRPWTRFGPAFDD